MQRGMTWLALMACLMVVCGGAALQKAQEPRAPKMTATVPALTDKQVVNLYRLEMAITARQSQVEKRQLEILLLNREIDGYQKGLKEFLGTVCLSEAGKFEVDFTQDPPVCKAVK